MRKNFFNVENAEALEHVAQKSCGCPTIESSQGQFGRSFEQPDIVKNVVTHGRGVALHGL